MKAKELIARLQKLPPDWEVLLAYEGVMSEIAAGRTGRNWKTDEPAFLLCADDTTFDAAPIPGAQR